MARSSEVTGTFVNSLHLVSQFVGVMTDALLLQKDPSTLGHFSLVNPGTATLKLLHNLTQFLEVKFTS